MTSSTPSEAERRIGPHNAVFEAAVKTARFIIAVLLLITVVAAQKAAEPEHSAVDAKKHTFATNFYVSKGGIGIVDRDLYVVVKSGLNELILKPDNGTEEQRWKGKSATEHEVVFVYAGKVWPSSRLPDGFELSKSVIVSFEGDKVRFFDFEGSAGGYYDRINP